MLLGCIARGIEEAQAADGMFTAFYRDDQALLDQFQLGWLRALRDSAQST